MKTTIELPDDLLIAAKQRAAELRRPLRVLIERGLRAELRRSRGTRRNGVKLNWVTVDGGLAPGLDVANRKALHDWLRTHR